MSVVILKIDVILAAVRVLTNEAGILQVNLGVHTIAKESRQRLRRRAIKLVKVEREVFMRQCDTELVR